MKPKYYPHVTLALAITLLLLPLSMLLLISSPASQSVDQLIAAADSQRPAVTPKAKAKPVATAIGQRPPTLVAMLSPEIGQQAISLDQPDIVPSVKPTDRMTYTVPSTAVDTGSVLLQTTPTFQSPVPTIVAEEPESPATKQLVASSGNTSSSPKTQTEDLDEELNAALAQRSSTTDTHFESTGHLAMTGSTGRTKSPRSRSVRSPRSNAKTESSSEAQMPTLLDEDPFASEPKNPIVDIMIQQPSERRPVSKVENLVATTQQPGWPIALIRSDIPDDVWWVQQMVGIRNRSFASRVNFGNDHSLPGSVYHLVIVFLDSADEARRFRIAKQFKDLPEGLRRSREFTFVRK